MDVDDTIARVIDFEVDRDGASFAATMTAQPRWNIDCWANGGSYVFDEGLAHKKGRQSTVTNVRADTDVIITSHGIGFLEELWQDLNPRLSWPLLYIAFKESCFASVDNLLKIDAVDVDCGSHHPTAN